MAPQSKARQAFRKKPVSSNWRCANPRRAHNRYQFALVSGKKKEQETQTNVPQHRLNFKQLVPRSSVEHIVEFFQRGSKKPRHWRGIKSECDFVASITVWVTLESSSWEHTVHNLLMRLPRARCVYAKLIGPLHVIKSLVLYLDLYLDPAGVFLLMMSVVANMPVCS